MMGKRLLGLFVVLAVLTAMAAPLFRPAAVLAAPPDTPTNLSPTGNDVSLTPTLRASAFHDSDNDTFKSSRWEIAGRTFDSGATTEYKVPLGYLTYGQVYSWQVLYRDSNDEWSNASDFASFMTVAAPQAAFTASKTTARAGESISFTNDSTGGSGTLSYSWTFGDGLTSTEKSPSHSYSAAGTYTVMLKVTDPDGPAPSNTSTETKTNYITITAPPVEAAFSASPTTAQVGQSVAFTNTSSGGSGALTYLWTFDDSLTSTEKSPSHSYSAAGTYTVTLTVTDSGLPPGTSTVTKTNYITIEPELTADFTADNTTVSPGRAVTFNATASGGVGELTYQWDFDNNGTTDGSGPTVSYTYATDGKKSVKLVVTDSATPTKNRKTVIKTDYITVAVALQVDFTAEPATVTPGKTVKFTSLVNGVVGTAAYEWDFNNDGKVDSTEQSPSFAYPEAGVYSVVLKVTDGAGSVTRTKTVTVTASVLAAFSADKTAVVLGQAVKFTNESGGGTPPLTYAWDFNGDGKTDSTEKDPSYTYLTVGTYKVTLKVTDSASKTSTETKDKYITVQGLAQADFTASTTSGAPGQTIAFTGSVTGGTPPIQYAWDFGDGGTSADQAPSHSYSAPGVYTVTLTITDSGGNTDVEKKVGYITIGDVGIAPCAIPAGGGIIQTADGRVSTTFPAGAYSGSATLTILEVSPSTAPKPPEGYIIGSACFSVEATDGTGQIITSLVRPATITMKYTSADLSAAGRNGANLKLAYYTAATGKWTVVNTSFNDTSQTLSATTTHFSTWAILVKPPSGGLAWWAKTLIILAGLVVVGIVAWKAFTIKQAEPRQRWSP